MADTIPIPRWLKIAALVAGSAWAGGMVVGRFANGSEMQAMSASATDADHESRIRAAERLLQERAAILATHSAEILALKDGIQEIKSAIRELTTEVRRR